jgi:hypothetical protein
MYVPGGKYTRAGVVVEDWHGFVGLYWPAQRLPSAREALIAAVSSVTPSPVPGQSRLDASLTVMILIPTAP